VRRIHYGRAARLTPREHEVALLVARGLSNRAIAEELVISEKTVKNHVQRVLDKLAMRSRTQVAASAYLLSA
jgi:DNA-binding NarL/FixJ family response regulator